MVRLMAAKVCALQQNTVHVLGFFEKTLNSPFYLALKHKALKPYAAAVERGMRLRSSMSHEFLEPLTQLRKLNKTDRRNVKRALEYFDAVAKKPTPDQQGNYTIRVEGARPDGDALFLVGSKLGDTFQLTGEAAKTFSGIRGAISSYYGHLKKATAASFGVDPNMPLAEMRRVDEDAAEALGMLQAAEREGYIPRIRNGDVGFTVTFPDGKEHFYTASPQGTDAIKFGKSRVNAAIKEAENIKRNLKAKYKLDDKAFGAIRLMEQDSIIEEVRKGNLSAVEGMMASLLNPNIMKNLKVTDENGLVVSPLPTLFKKMREEVTRRGQAAHLRKRKDVPGYLHDANFDSYFEGALASYLVRGADFTSGLYVAKEKNESINNLQNVNLKNWARDHNNSLHVPQSLAWMKNVAFNYSLGWNISSAMINFTQNLHTTFPYLSVMSGNPMTTSVQMAKAFKDVSKLMVNWETIKDPINTFVSSKAVQNMKPDERDFIVGLIQQGIARPITTQEMLATDSNIQYGENYDKLAPFGRQFMASASAAFSTVETMNRLVAGLTAYRMLRASPSMMKKMSRWKKEASIYENEPDTPEFLARLAVEDTQFIITKENRPSFMQGDIASVAFQFQQYPMAMLELIGKMSRFADPQQKALFMSLLGLGIMSTAGIWGLPFARPLKELVEGVSRATGPLIGNQPLSFDFVKELALETGRLFNSEDPQYVADAILNGLTRLGGVETGRRTALEIIPTDLLSGQSIDMAGPFGGVVIGGAQQFAQYLNSGQPGHALASLLPLAFRNAYQGATGELITPTSGRSRIPAGSLSGEDRIRKAMGFTPASVARRGEAARELSKEPMEIQRKAWQNSIASHLVDSHLYEKLGNTEAAERSMEKARELAARAAQHDEDVEDPNLRLIGDSANFQRGIKSKVQHDLEGPLGHEADKGRGSKEEVAAKRAKINPMYKDIL